VFALVLVPFLRGPHPGSRTNRNPFLKGSLTMFRLPFRKLAFVLAVALAYAGAAPRVRPACRASSRRTGRQSRRAADGCGREAARAAARVYAGIGTQLKSWSRKLLNDNVARGAVVYVVVVAAKRPSSRAVTCVRCRGAAVGSKDQINSNVLVTFNETAGSRWYRPETSTPPASWSATPPVTSCTRSAFRTPTPLSPTSNGR